MSERLALIWDTLVFYGPAAYSLLAVAASGLMALVIWLFFRRRK